MSIIAVDFDGTLCEIRWPEIGQENRHVIDALKRRHEQGDKLILWTCREGLALAEAVSWCIARGLWFDAINANLAENIGKYGNDCRKVFADEYWDDKSVIVYAGSAPSVLMKDGNGGYRSMHWERTSLTVVKMPLRTRIRRWWYRWRCV